MPRPNKFRIVAGSMSSFLDPPGSPQREYHVVERYANGKEASSLSLLHAIDQDYVPAEIKAEIALLYAAAEMEPTEEWLSQVYGYFKNCYSPDGKDRSVANARIIDSDSRLPIETSLAVMHVRSFFPDHEPREDLLTAGKWGS
jgi:hypothetical protein